MRWKKCGKTWGKILKTKWKNGGETAGKPWKTGRKKGLKIQAKWRSSTNNQAPCGGPQEFQL